MKWIQSHLFYFTDNFIPVLFHKWKSIEILSWVKIIFALESKSSVEKKVQDMEEDDDSISSEEIIEDKSRITPDLLQPIEEL